MAFADSSAIFVHGAEDAADQWWVSCSGDYIGMIISDRNDEKYHFLFSFGSALGFSDVPWFYLQVFDFHRPGSGF